MVLWTMAIPDSQDSGHDFVVMSFVIGYLRRELSRIIGFIHKVILSLGPNLTLYSLFHLQFECTHKVREGRDTVSERG
jgi:hypothetical protein